MTCRSGAGPAAQWRRSRARNSRSQQPGHQAPGGRAACGSGTPDRGGLRSDYFMFIMKASKQHHKGAEPDFAAGWSFDTCETSFGSVSRDREGGGALLRQAGSGRLTLVPGHKEYVDEVNFCQAVEAAQPGRSGLLEAPGGATRARGWRATDGRAAFSATGSRGVHVPPPQYLNECRAGGLLPAARMEHRDENLRVVPRSSPATGQSPVGIGLAQHESRSCAPFAAAAPAASGAGSAARAGVLRRSRRARRGALSRWPAAWPAARSDEAVKPVAGCPGDEIHAATDLKGLVLRVGRR